jgi:hypothetical protein
VCCIDIDTNGEVDFSSTQLPFTAFARAAAESAPMVDFSFIRPDERDPTLSSPSSSRKLRTTSAF